jgi:hypothetical protein
MTDQNSSEITPPCTWGQRHWFAYRRMVGSSSPTCTHPGCSAKNPNYRPAEDPYREAQ